MTIGQRQIEAWKSRSSELGARTQHLLTLRGLEHDYPTREHSYEHSKLEQIILTVCQVSDLKISPSINLSLKIYVAFISLSITSKLDEHYYGRPR